MASRTPFAHPVGPCKAGRCIRRNGSAKYCAASWTKSRHSLRDCLTIDLYKLSTARQDKPLLCRSVSADPGRAKPRKLTHTQTQPMIAEGEGTQSDGP